ELEVNRLQQEGTSIVGAGVETTKSTLTLATFYILKNPKVLQRLRKELKQVFPDPNKPPELSELEQLPFLTAIIRESLRLSNGVAQRLPRVSRTPIQYSTYTIPPGFPISMSAYVQHRDERIFPSSKTFNPDRWIDPTQERHLSRYLVSFSKGTRMCLGVNLAWAEMYIGLATVFRRVELELFETESDAVDMAREYFVPLPKRGTKGVRVLVK
ncbi:MAG: hypothetical protein Q9214_002626, partial [Letrouitia sp. 1 TL-2023]